MVVVLPYLTRVIAGITVPNTPLINSAIALARAELPDHGYNHVMRAWLNGQALINHLPSSNRSRIDVEAFGIAAILHDLGWSNNTEIVSTDKSFEVDGANAARSFIRRESKRGWDKHRIQLVWDAIALHTNSELNHHKELEVIYTAAGTSTDVNGIELSKEFWGDLITITQEEYDAIAAEYPWSPGWRKYFRDLMIGFCISKPQVTYNNFVGDWGERYVEGYTRVGKRPIDHFDCNDTLNEC